jgi:hypothetical protein
LMIRGVALAGDDGSLRAGDPTGVGPAAASMASTASGMGALEWAIGPEPVGGARDRTEEAPGPVPGEADAGDRVGMGLDGTVSAAVGVLRCPSGGRVEDEGGRMGVVDTD